MVEEGDDSVVGELTAAVDDLTRRFDDLELRSLFTGEYDENDAIAELHSGAGGTDAQDWCEMLLRMYQRWAERRGFDVEIEETTAGQEAGLLSATFIVKGRFAYGLLSAERGVHRLVRMSPFDSQHRRQTSFASVDVTPFLEDLSDEIDHRRQGAADRHLPVVGGRRPARQQDRLGRPPHPSPTGLVVSVQNERSQHQNKAKAMQILGAKLAERQRAERRSELDSLVRTPVRGGLGQSDPLLRDGALSTGQGSPHPGGDRQRRRRTRRRHRHTSSRPNCVDRERRRVSTDHGVSSSDAGRHPRCPLTMSPLRVGDRPS